MYVGTLICGGVVSFWREDLCGVKQTSHDIGTAKHDNTYLTLIYIFQYTKEIVNLGSQKSS